MTAKELLRERVESLSEEEAENWLDEMIAAEHSRTRRLSPVEIARLPVEERWAHFRPEDVEVEEDEIEAWDATDAAELSALDD